MDEHEQGAGLIFGRCNVMVGRGTELWEATDGVIAAYVHGPGDRSLAAAMPPAGAWLWATTARSNRLRRLEGCCDSRQDAMRQAVGAADQVRRDG
jgi:hypothetical protein